MPGCSEHQALSEGLGTGGPGGFPPVLPLPFQLREQHGSPPPAAPASGWSAGTGGGCVPRGVAESPARSSASPAPSGSPCAGPGRTEGRTDGGKDRRREGARSRAGPAPPPKPVLRRHLAAGGGGGSGAAARTPEPWAHGGRRPPLQPGALRLYRPWTLPSPCKAFLVSPRLAGCWLNNRRQRYLLVTLSPPEFAAGSIRSHSRDVLNSHDIQERKVPRYLL